MNPPRDESRQEADDDRPDDTHMPSTHLPFGLSQMLSSTRSNKRVGVPNGHGLQDNRHLGDDLPDTETDDHYSSFVDRKGHPNIQEAGSWVALWSFSASKPLTLRTSDQIAHQIKMAIPIAGMNVTRTDP